jgi:hypothetical protein
MSLCAQYSPYFSTIYDQAEPVGKLGIGTHYSILQVVEHHDVMMTSVQPPQLHRFAVVWDEDHDTRVIPLLEKLYLEGLLSPVQFIGERKGILHVVFAARYALNTDDAKLSEHKDRIEEISESGLCSDSWPAEFGFFDRNPCPISDCGYHQCEPPSIINAQRHLVLDFMRHIDALWSLGTYEYTDSDLSRIE